MPADVRPTAEALEMHIDPARDRFSGVADIALALSEPHSTLWLHGKGLHVSAATVTPEGGRALAGTWAQHDPSGLAEVSLPSALPAGKAVLHLEFDAPWGPRTEGLYRVSQDSSTYAVTQFEAIAARTAFPCFDEPGIKVPFTTTLVVPAGLVAISNTHEVSRESAGKDVEVHFAPTVPLPSYLQAFAVGPFDIVSGADIPPNAVRRRPLPLRVITAKGRAKDGAYARAHAGEILATLERQIGLEYPYDKLDLIAVPDKGGAMENAGALIFDDGRLLFDEKTAAFYRFRGYASVMAHELAHQWTGDLVTATWWDDLWLNEAFASWLGPAAADAWNPKLEVGLARLAGSQLAMSQDALVSARAIRQPIVSTNDIENAFDGITYSKGAGVLAMFERWVGPATFAQGLRAYLGQHRFGAATADDFLDAESAAAGRDVKTPFHTFLDQPGVPFVEAELRCDGSPRLHLKQSRYLPLGSTGDPSPRWQIPICARFPAGGGVHEACTLLTGTEGELPLGVVPCPAWVFPNAEAAGYFRFALAPKDLASLRQKGLASLSVPERLAYANSLNAAYARGVISYQDALAAAAPLAADAHPRVAVQPMPFLGEARDWLYETPLRPVIEREDRDLYGARGAKLGWQPAPGEDPNTLELRQQVLLFLVFHGRDPRVRAEGKRRGLAYLGYGKDGVIHPEAVDPNLLGAALGVVGEEADRTLWDAVHAMLAKTDDADLRRNLIRVLSLSTKPALTPAILDLAFDPTLRAVEVTEPIWNQLDQHETREATWQWVKANFDRLLAAVPKHHGQTQLISMGESFCDEAHARDIEAFFTPQRLAGIEGAPRVLSNTLESVRLCAAKRKVQEPRAREVFSAMLGE